MLKEETLYLILLIPILAISLLLINEGYSQGIPQDTGNAKALSF